VIIYTCSSNYEFILLVSSFTQRANILFCYLARIGLLIFQLEPLLIISGLYFVSSKIKDPYV